MKYILALDEGTTTVRALLFDIKENKIIRVEKLPFTQHFPAPGWVEHNATEIWEKLLLCMKNVTSDILKTDIAGIGITTQRETVVLWDKRNGKPVYNAIVWQCRRTAKRCKALKESEWAKKIHKKTGLLPDAYFSASKIEWILKNVPKARTLLKSGNLMAGTMDSFLCFKLTGGKQHITDITNASRTMLFNINTLKWDDELLSLFNIPASILPTVVDNCGDFGQTQVLGTSIPIAGLVGDQQSSMFGQACHDKGMVKNTYGTGCFILMNIGDKPKFSKNELLTTIGYKINQTITYAIEGSVFNAGCLVDWCSDGLDIIKDANDINNIALQIDSNQGVYLVPAFTGLGAPYWDMEARGILTGLTRGTTQCHIARAVLESMAYSTYDIVKLMEKDSGVAIKEMHVDGGASRNDFLMQFQSDILGTTLNRYPLESTCLGAIYLTGLGVGVYKNIAEVRKLIKQEDVFIPSKNTKKIKEYLQGWQKAVRQCLTK